MLIFQVFPSPILQNLNGKSVLDKSFFENDPLDEPKKMTWGGGGGGEGGGGVNNTW